MEFCLVDKKSLVPDCVKLHFGGNLIVKTQSTSIAFIPLDLFLPDVVISLLSR